MVQDEHGGEAHFYRLFAHLSQNSKMQTIAALEREDFAFRLISLPNPYHPEGLDGIGIPAINHDVHLVHVTRGEVEFCLKDGRSVVGKPDCVVAIPPYQFYTCRQKVRKELEMINVHFKITWGERWTFQDIWEFPLLFRPERLSAHVKALRTYGELWRRMDVPFPRRWRAAFGVHELVNTYASKYARPLEKPVTDVAMLETRRMIEDSVIESFVAGSIASRTGLSIAQLNRRFRRAFGLPPKEYWQRCLLRLAMAKLLEPGVSIKEASDALGFSDQFYFSRWFRRMQGTSPRGFRLRTESLP